MEFLGKYVELHKGEEFLRSKNLKWIAEDEELRLHMRMVGGAADVIYAFIEGHAHENHEELMMQCLGIRLFNAFASSVKLMLSGYYQNSALVLRDVLETVFLLDYFNHKPEQISVWLNSNEKQRIKKFSPKEIRKELDERDGFTSGKRAELYQLFCNIAAHPTPQGFSMLTPVAGGDAHCGPFAERSALVAVLSEMGRLAIQAGIKFHVLFPKSSIALKLKSLEFLEIQMHWAERFYDRPFNAAVIEAAKTELQMMEKNSGKANS